MNSSLTLYRAPNQPTILVEARRRLLNVPEALALAARRIELEEGGWYFKGQDTVAYTSDHMVEGRDRPRGSHRGCWFEQVRCSGALGHPVRSRRPEGGGEG
jgi:hypothetical protein